MWLRASGSKQNKTEPNKLCKLIWSVFERRTRRIKIDYWIVYRSFSDFRLFAEEMQVGLFNVVFFAFVKTHSTAMSFRLAYSARARGQTLTCVGRRRRRCPIDKFLFVSWRGRPRFAPRMTKPSAYWLIFVVVVRRTVRVARDWRVRRGWLFNRANGSIRNNGRRRSREPISSRAARSTSTRHRTSTAWRASPAPSVRIPALCRVHPPAAPAATLSLHI